MKRTKFYTITPFIAYAQSSEFLTIISTLKQIGIGVFSSILAALILFILGLLIPPLRYSIFYKLHHYDLEYDSSFKSCYWKIQWENQLLRIKANNVHSDHLEKAKIQLGAYAEKYESDKLFVSKSFIDIPKNWPVQIKIDSIVRTADTEDGIREYTVRVVIRRRRY